MSLFDLARHLPNLWQNEKSRTQLFSSIGMLAGIGAGIAGYAYLHEPLQVQMDYLTIYLPKTKGQLPPAGLRILHLSDTHFQGANWREQAKIDCIRKACAGLSYDLLIHTGDFLHHDSGLPNVLALLDALPVPRVGSYAVFGNHDYCTYSHEQFLERAWSRFCALQQTDEGRLLIGNGHGAKSYHAANGYASRNANYNGSNGNRNDAGRPNGRTTPLHQAQTLLQFGRFFANAPMEFERSGNNDANALEAALTGRQIQTLHNRYVRLTRPELELDIYLAGVDDVQEGKPELPSALAEIPYDAPTILLSHNPDILLEPGVEQADLVLAGHTHGGQIVLPLFGAAHTQSQYLRRNEAAGYLRRGKTQIYITRGVGEGIPLRFGAAPQITLLTVLPA
jgi:predicted MPP superfamily phosphohydrolase